MKNKINNKNNNIDNLIIIKINIKSVITWNIFPCNV